MIVIIAVLCSALCAFALHPIAAPIAFIAIIVLGARLINDEDVP
jgi:hypothetical protein